MYKLVNKQWNYTQTLNPTLEPSKGNDWFGHEVRVHKNLLVVAAPWFSFNNQLNETGIVYLYTKGEGGLWKQTLILQEQQTANGNRFGYLIEVDEENVYITGHGHNDTYYFRHIPYSKGEDTLWFGYDLVFHFSPTFYFRHILYSAGGETI